MTTQELVNHLYAEAMKLPEKERLQLIMSLSETMGPEGVDIDDSIDHASAAWSDAWLAEIEERVKRAKAGAPGVSLDEVMADARALTQRQR
jgi:hypothetical protein